MTFEIWDLIPEQERLSNKEEHRLSLRNPWHEMTSTLLNTPWKVETPWGNTVDSEKENKQYSAQLGGKERWFNEESVNKGQCGSKKDNQWTSTFRSHRGQYCSKTFHDLVNSSSNWKQRCTWGTTSYLHLELPSKTWLWLLTDVIVWMHLNEHWKDAHHQDWLWDYLFWSSKAHFTIWIWVIN
jgi:hypothetical protein